MNTDKVYILQHNFADLEAGAEFRKISAMSYGCINNPEYHIELSIEFVEKNPLWFKKKENGLPQQKGLAHGAYKINWVDGGYSIASVGFNHDGTNWFAPCNWTSENNKQPIVASTDWSRVKSFYIIIGSDGNQPLINSTPPSKKDLKDPIFNAIWDVIKKWDIDNGCSGERVNYHSATGDDVMEIFTKLKPIIDELQRSKVC